MPKIPQSLHGLRARLVSSPEQRARVHLKQLLDTHGQHIGKKTLALFRQTLNGLLLHGLRTRPIKSAESAEPNASGK